MRFSETVPSNYLKAADLQGVRAKVVIESVGFDEFQNSKTGKKDRKVIINFVGKEKGIVVNVTNGNVLVDAYGDDMDGWVGKPVILYAGRTTYMGKPCMGIMVDIPGNKAVTQAPKQRPVPQQPQIPPEAEEVGNEPIPEFDDVGPEGDILF
jgi:hypothetical protein